MLAIRLPGRRAGVPAGLLALACLVSVASGFFDGGLGNDALSPALAAYQVVLLAVTGLTGLAAAAHLSRCNAALWIAPHAVYAGFSVHNSALQAGRASLAPA